MPRGLSMKTGERETIAAHLKKSGVSRRSFLQLCSTLIVAAPVRLSLTSKATAAQVARIVGKSRRPSVIWLHFQDCTGCTETLLRTSAPDVAHLILDVISLDYHETLMAASGAQAEAALRSAIADNAGKYVLVVEGAIPARDDGVYMELGGRPAIQVVKEVAAQAAAVIAIAYTYSFWWIRLSASIFQVRLCSTEKKTSCAQHRHKDSIRTRRHCRSA